MNMSTAVVLAFAVFAGGLIATMAVAKSWAARPQADRSVSERGAEAQVEFAPVVARRPKSGTVIELAADGFQREVLDSDVPALVDFYAHWCGPCRMQAPVLDAMARESNQVKIVKVNIDEHGELAAAFGVESIPTLLVFDKGKPVLRHVGLASKRELTALLSSVSPPQAGSMQSGT